MFDIPLHKLLVHFPIVLGIFAFLYDAWAAYAHRPELHDTGYSLSLWAALAAIASVLTGLQIADLRDIGKSAITGHALFGISTALVLIAFALWRYSAKARQEAPRENFSSLWLIIEGIVAVLVMATAITGHLIFGG